MSIVKPGSGDGNTPAERAVIRSALSAGLDPEMTWIAWYANVRYIAKHEVVRHKPLAGRIQTTNTADPFDLKEVMSDFGENDIVSRPTVPDIIQQVAGPSPVIVLEGYAVRYGLKIPIPRIVKIGGVEAVTMHEDINHTQIMSVQTVPIYSAKWNIFYALPEPPQHLPMLANPAQGVIGQN